MRSRHFVSFLILFFGFQAVCTNAQVTATWTDSTGNWSNAANWSTNTVPNNNGTTTYDVVINGTGHDTVTYDLNGGVISVLSLGSGETFQDSASGPSFTTGGITLNANLGPGSTFNWTHGGTLSGGDLSNYLSSFNVVNGNLTLSSIFAHAGNQLIQNSTANIGTITTEFGSNISVDSSKVNVSGDININGNASGISVSNSTMQVQGILNLFQSSASISNSHFDTNGGVLVNDEGILTIDGSHVTAGSLSIVTFASAVITNSVLNLGAISVAGSSGSDARLDISGSTLSASSIFNDGSFQTGPGGTLTVNGGGVSNTSNGTFDFHGTGGVTGGFANSGAVLINSDANLVADNYSQSAGSTDISGKLTAGSFNATGGTVAVNGTLASAATHFDTSSLLQGTGKMIGDVSMAGTLMPGLTSAPGTLTISGNYAQMSHGTLIDLMSPLSQSLLSVSGNVVLGSNSLLQINLLNGFNPLGKTFDVMDYSSLSGQFSNGTSFFADGYLWDVTYGPNEIEVTAVGTPEPGSFLLLGLGLMFIAVFAKKRIIHYRTA